MSASRPTRVAMVIQRFRPAFSGQGVQLEELCRALARRGVEPTIVTAMREAPAPAEEREGGVRVVRLPAAVPGPAALREGLRWPVFAARVLAFLWRHRRSIDLVHVHALTDALYAAWLFCRFRRVPLVFEMTLLGEDDPLSVRANRSRPRRLRRALFARCDGYVAISPAIARAYRDAGLPPDRLRVIPQGVDVTRFRPYGDRSARRRDLGLPLAGPLVTFVGSLVERKGLDVLLAAWARIHAERPDAHLLLVGRDEFPAGSAESMFLQRELERTGAGAGANVHRLGLRDDPERLLAASDVFVFPSRREGFGSVIIEAMACGLPCVVAELPGITDFIFAEPGRDGVVVPPESPDALASAVRSLLADPASASAMGAAARRRVEAAFAMDRIAAAYLDLYATLARRARTR